MSDRPTTDGKGIDWRAVCMAVLELFVLTLGMTIVFSMCGLSEPGILALAMIGALEAADARYRRLRK